MITNVFRAFLKRRGVAVVKQRIWDHEYRSGKWERTGLKEASHKQTRDIVLDVIDRYGRGKDILDLGCGDGATGLEIADTYRQYVGVDVSRVAILSARLSFRQDSPRTRNNTYLVSDISTFVPEGQSAVILFRESIYYFSAHLIKRMLHRYSSFLVPGGVFVVRLHDRVKYHRITEFIEQHYRVVERCESQDNAGLVLVFAPADR